MAKKVVTNCCLDLDILNWLNEEARARGSTVSKVMNELLSEYMRNKTAARERHSRLATAKSDA